MSGSDEELVVRAQARLGSVLRGKYRLDRVLGIGGMATVYAATHRNGNEFAVKVLHPDLSLRAELRNRFLREGHAAGSVRHPGAVQVFDDDVAEDGSAFLVMELLRGESIEILWERRQQRLPVRLVAGIGIQLLDVLAAAHERGVIHRDIKPANLFLTHAGQVKVLDFGIARLRDLAVSQATQTGMMMGTPAFMAPEQAMAKTSDIDAQTDVWSAGATMFTLASGKLVHEADNAQQIMIRAATTPAPSFASVVHDAPPLIAEVIDRALAFEKSERWTSAAAMREALKNASRSVFGAAPSAEAVAEIIEELGEEATVVQSLDLPPPHPGLQRRAVSPNPTTDEVTAPVARVGSDVAQVTTQPLPVVEASSAPRVGSTLHAGLVTAEPVMRDSGARRRRPLSGRFSPLTVGIAAFGATAVVVSGIALIATFGRPPRPAASASAIVSAPPALPATSSDTAEISSTTAGVAAPPSSAQVVPIDDLPSAPTPSPVVATARTAAPPVAPPSAVHPGPPRKPGCNPPYVLDAHGDKQWKRECL